MNATNRKRTLASDAYKIIKEKIIFCEYSPGQLLNLRALTEEIGFKSFTPVREALVSLRDEDLVKIVPRQGMFVSELSLNDVTDNYQIREIIEPTTLGITCPLIKKETIKYYREKFEEIIKTEDSIDYLEYLKVDMDFHIDLIKPLNNNNLSSILKNIYEQNTRYRMACFKKRLPEVMILEHIEILDTIEEKDSQKASMVLKKHIINSRNALISQKLGLVD
ncbi:MAG: GntR family transcriptional regulator [Vallitalea sp.]|jgi:DNA-binding GntR family transcriptional regulator|nr:GntR family transcriptional regulator [Vallitalea sp.]